MRYVLFNADGTEAGRYPDMQKTMDVARPGMYAHDTKPGARWPWDAFYQSGIGLIGQPCDTETEARAVAQKQD